MATHILCISADLAKDADLYSSQVKAYVISASELHKVKSGDTLIIYGHGQYAEHGQGGFVATNKVIWGKRALDGSQVCDALLDSDLDTGLVNLTIIAHCCFTAGTKENPPTEVESQHTFAGQLCSALKAFYFPGLRVIGYQGASKTGKAGFAANATANAPRLSRSQADPNQGELWQMVYGGEGDRETFLAKGSSAKWS